MRIDAVSTTLPRRASRRGRENSSRPSRSRIGHDVADVEPLENTSCAHISGVGFHTGDIGAWDISSVKSLGGIFRETKSFNQDLRSWDTSSVILMRHAFLDAEAFDPDNAPLDTHNVPEFANAWG